MRRFLFALFFAIYSISYAADYVDGKKFSEEEIEQFDGISSATVSPTNAARIYYDSEDDKLKLSENGGPYGDFGTPASSVTESIVNLSWLKSTDQTGLTGDKSGSFDITTTGNITGLNFVSTVAIGTSPYACTSTTLNTNLNADLWDGFQFSDYLDQAVKQASSPTFVGLTLSGAISTPTNITASGTIQAEQLTSTDDADINDVCTVGSLVTDTGGITLLAGQNIKPSTDGTGAIRIANAAGTAFALFDSTNGKMSIGTANAPNATFDVANFFGIDNVSAMPADKDAYALWLRTSGSGGSAPFNQAGSAIYRTRVSSTAGRSSHLFYTGSPTAERMRIDETGNVGVGTIAPSAKLHVAGGIQSDDSVTAPIIKLTSSGTISATTGDIYIENDASDKDIIFKVNDGGVDTTLMTMDGSSSKVGIGTTEPGNTLDVAAGTSNIVVRFQSSDPNAYIKTQDDTGSALFGNVGNDVIIHTGEDTTNPKVTVKATTGNVGIGTIAPSAKLHVTGGIQSDDSITAPTAVIDTNTLVVNQKGYEDKVGIGTATPAQPLDVVGNIKSSGTLMFSSNFGMRALSSIVRFDGGSSFPLGYNFATNTVQTGAMAIVDAGNVGIGTLTPGLTAFDANTKILSVVSASDNTPGAIELIGENNGSYGAGNWMGRLRYGVHEQAGDYDDLAEICAYSDNNDDDTGSMAFRTATNGSLATAMTILYSGNVGIGKTAPSAKLDVTGGINASDSITAPTVVIDTNTLVVNQKGYEDKVGIGTITPSEKLDVDNGAFAVGYTTNTYDRLIRLRRNNADIMSIDNTAGGGYIRAENNNNIFLTDDSGNGIAVLDGGNVGIGASPETDLDLRATNVVPSFSTEGNFNVATTDAQAADIGGSITLGGTVTDGNTANRVFGSIEGRKTNSTSGNTDGYLSLKTSLSNVLTERVRILNTGNVGVGTITPTAKLDVTGGINASDSITAPTVVIDTNTLVVNQKGYEDKVGIGTATPTTKAHIVNSVAGDTADVILTMQNTGAASTSAAWKFYSTSGNDWTMGKNPDGTTSGYFGILDNNGYKMVIGQGTTGYVGIGNVSPAHKLDVTGSINASVGVTAPIAQISNLGAGWVKSDTVGGLYTVATIPTGGGSGTVTSITAGTGVTCTPDPITTTGTIAIGQAVATTSTPTFANVTTTTGVTSPIVQITNIGTGFVKSDSVGGLFSTTNLSGTLSTTTNIKGEPKHLRFTIFDPLAVQTDDSEVCIWNETDADITITSLKVSLDATTNEIAGDVKYADTFIGLANAVVINDFDTTSGVRSDTSITQPRVPTGKAIYISFDSAPNTAITQANFDITYNYDG